MREWYPIPSSADEVARRRLRFGVPPPSPDPPRDADAITRAALEVLAGLVEANRLLLVRLERLEVEARRERDAASFLKS